MMSSCFFFFNDTATTEIYTLSLHDALPISQVTPPPVRCWQSSARDRRCAPARSSLSCRPEARELASRSPGRSEEHTSELQSRQYLVCRLLLEKKKTTNTSTINA